MFYCNSLKMSEDIALIFGEKRAGLLAQIEAELEVVLNTLTEHDFQDAF
jgi:hypothetical protein